jgi:hypothetical protein
MKPAFVPTDFDLAGFSVATSEEDAIVGTMTLDPSTAPTRHPTHRGYVISTAQQTVAVVRVELTLGLTATEAADPVMTSALTLGLSRALGLSQEQVQLTHIDGTPLATRRRQLQYSNLRQLLASVRTRFEIESASADAAVVDGLRNDVRDAAAEGSIVANMQKAASESGVLTTSLSGMQRAQVLFAADVTIGATTKTMAVQVRPGPPTPSPIVPTSMPTAGSPAEALDWCTSECWTGAGALVLVLVLVAVWYCYRQEEERLRDREAEEAAKQMTALARSKGKQRLAAGSFLDVPAADDHKQRASLEAWISGELAAEIPGELITQKSFWQRSMAQHDGMSVEDRKAQQKLKWAKEVTAIRHNLYATATRHNKKISKVGSEKIENMLHQLSQGMMEFSGEVDAASAMVEDYDPISKSKVSGRGSETIRYTSINCKAGELGEASRHPSAGRDIFELRTIDKNTRRAQERAHKRASARDGSTATPGRSRNSDLEGDLKHKRMKYVFVITMYEESPLEVKASLDGVHRNVDELVKEGDIRRARIGDEAADKEGMMDGWESACVVIVADGE